MYDLTPSQQKITDLIATDPRAHMIDWYISQNKTSETWTIPDTDEVIIWMTNRLKTYAAPHYGEPVKYEVIAARANAEEIVFNFHFYNQVPNWAKIIQINPEAQPATI